MRQLVADFLKGFCYSVAADLSRAMTGRVGLVFPEDRSFFGERSIFYPRIKSQLLLAKADSLPVSQKGPGFGAG